MGTLDDIFKVANKVHKRQTYVVVITDLGKDKLEKPGVTEYQWQILNYLSENGPSPLRDIVAGTGITEDKVKSMCKKLSDDGFVMKRNTGGGD